MNPEEITRRDGNGLPNFGIAAILDPACSGANCGCNWRVRKFYQRRRANKVSRFSHTNRSIVIVTLYPAMFAADLTQSVHVSAI